MPLFQATWYVLFFSLYICQPHFHSSFSLTQSISTMKQGRKEEKIRTIEHKCWWGNYKCNHIRIKPKLSRKRKWMRGKQIDINFKDFLLLLPLHPSFFFLLLLQRGWSSERRKGRGGCLPVGGYRPHGENFLLNKWLPFVSVKLFEWDYQPQRRKGIRDCGYLCCRWRCRIKWTANWRCMKDPLGSRLPNYLNDSDVKIRAAGLKEK